MILRVKDNEGNIIPIPAVKGDTGDDGVSPTITITTITGGHRVTITDADGDHTFDVMDGSGGTSVHGQLTGRDASDQHPMSAITGLVAELSGKGTYSKPSAGIPSSDLASAVQTSLGKADSAISDPSTKSNGQVLTYNGSAWEARNASSGMTGTTYTATLSSSGWSTSSGYKTQTVSVSGIKATYDVAPAADCVLSGSDATADAAILEGFGLISIITTAAGSITAKCVGDAPSVNVPIVINVWE